MGQESTYCAPISLIRSQPDRALTGLASTVHSGCAQYPTNLYTACRRAHPSLPSLDSCCRLTAPSLENKPCLLSSSANKGCSHATQVTRRRTFSCASEQVVRMMSFPNRKGRRLNLTQRV